MGNEQFIKEFKELTSKGLITTYKELQDKNGWSRPKVDGEIDRGEYEKIKISGIYILIKK